MVIVMTEDKVQCMICKKWFKQLNGHLVKHNITSKEYLGMFPGASLMSEKLINDKMGNGNSFYNEKHTNKTKSKISIGNTGKVRSKETRNKISSGLKIKNRFKYLFKQMDLYVDLSLGRKIQCKICGEILQQLSKHLVYKHSVSVKEYKELYPNALSVAPFLNKIMIDNNVEKWQDSDYKKNIADKNRIKTIKQLTENPKFFDTSIELKMQSILSKNGYKYVTHQPCCNVCLPDIMFPKYKIVIFCDGDYWHNLPNYIERDKYQNKILKENGWTVLRFWEHEINEDIEGCLEKFESEYWGEF